MANDYKTSTIAVVARPTFILIKCMLLQHMCQTKHISSPNAGLRHNKWQTCYQCLIATTGNETTVSKLHYQIDENFVNIKTFFVVQVYYWVNGHQLGQ